MTTAQGLLSELKARGIRLETRPNGNLHLTPKSRVTAELLEAARQHKRALIALLGACSLEVQTITTDSRHPLVSPAVRKKIEEIEATARAEGWPAELLWNGGFWDCPRGLAALLDPEDEIWEVAPDFIEILKTRRHLVKFRRFVA
jgi:hypothetical protein